MGRSNNKKKQNQKGKGHEKRSIGDSSTKNNEQHRSSAQQQDANNSEGRDIYAKYKAATRSFRDGLSKLLPSSSVGDLGNSVEYLLAESSSPKESIKKIPVSTGLLSCLNESIKLREQFTELCVGGDDLSIVT